MSSYPEYKSCDGDWINEIPASWDIVRGKYLFEILKRIIGKTGVDVLSITQRGIKIKDIRSGDGQLSMDYSKYQIVNPGDFAMNHMDLLTGYVDLSPYFGVTSPDYRVFRVRHDSTFSKFYLYVLQMAYTNKVFFKYGQGASHLGRWRLPTEEFNNFCYPSPPDDDKKSIIEYLDHETDKIDILIEKQQQLIKLLKEKRQAVISHAVTKGLNPDAPMKDSGVEWLGNVPEHWIVAKIGYRYEILLGKMLDDKKISGNYLGSYLRNTDVQWNGINVDNLPKMDFRPEERERYSVKKGDLLVCEGGEIGRCSIWNSDYSCFYQKALHRLRPYSVSKDSVEYMRYLLNDAVHQERFISGAGKATIAHLPAETFRRYRFAFPSLCEQLRIVHYLDQIEKRYNQLENKAERQILLLKERRTALISAAVTGKIDVRNWQPESSSPCKEAS